MSLCSGFNCSISPSTIALPAVCSNKITSSLIPSVATKPITSVSCSRTQLGAYSYVFFLANKYVFLFLFVLFDFVLKPYFCIFHLHIFLLIFYSCVSLPVSPTNFYFNKLLQNSLFHEQGFELPLQKGSLLSSD